MASPVLEILTLGLVLSADSFSAAFAMGHRPFTSRDALRFALASGSAEALSALIGALGGSFILSRFASIDHWIAFGLLTAVALHMLWEGLGHLRSGLPPGKKEEFHGPLRILMVSFATSLDALGVGVGFGVTGKPILPFLGSIGVWAFLATLAGLHLSRRLSRRAGPVMAIVGAGVLEIIAIQMLKA
jgi:putative Mn2+ efflux pump MntP